MRMIATVFTALVALLHLGFVALEMFFWNHPIGQKVFGTTQEFAAETQFMASNQGLYNGFLVAGLVWGLVAKKRDVTVFFLLCVIVAGVFGAITVKPTIFLVQALPAVFALGATMLSKPSVG
ncbi:UNVERIFIED_CONTAM: hypothetical protein GTU68_041099 [Idotea baltica]|nr:hypothetical protein [Idotea baltica]